MARFARGLGSLRSRSGLASLASRVEGRYIDLSTSRPPDLRFGLLGLVLLLSLSAACSPEASRTQGGGPGADIGNHSQTVPLHGDGVMFYNTPREGQAITK